MLNTALRVTLLLYLFVPQGQKFNLWKGIQQDLFFLRQDRF